MAYHSKYSNPDVMQSMLWRPLPLNYVMERFGLKHRPTALLFSGWVLLFVVCIGTVTWMINSQNLMLEPSHQSAMFFVILYSPLLVSNLLLFWLGFEWAFIPAFLSTFLIAFASGMAVHWALLFGIAVVLGLAIFSLIYYSTPITYDLHSITSVAFFVAVAFVASMASSLGSFIWSHTHEFTVSATVLVWKGWWTGTFLQAVFINGPLLYFFSRRVEKWKLQKMDVPARPEISSRWIYGAIISVVLVISIFILAAETLGNMRVAEELNNYPNASRQAILGATESFELTAWIGLLLVLGAGMGGIHLVSRWNRSLRNKVDDRTRRLQESEQRFRSTFDQAAVGVAHIDLDGQWLRVNDKLCRMTGYKRDELQNMQFMDVIHPDDHSEDLSRYRQLIFGEIASLRSERRYIRRDNSVIWINMTLSVVRNEDLEAKYLIAILEDVTERKRAEEALRREKMFSDSLINTLPGIFYLFDEDGNLLRWNDNLARLTGFSDNGQKKNLQFIAEEDRNKVFDTTQKMVHNGYGGTEAQLLTRDGDKVPFFLTGLRFKSNGSSYIIGTGIDISDRKEYEEQIKHSLREKETLLSEIHHRVKNNLAVVSALLELQARNVDDEPTINILQQARSRIKSMAMVHKQLYQSASLSDIKMDDYIEQLSDIIKNTFSNKQIDVEIRRDLDNVSLNIKQAIPCGLILNELIINAYKHAFKAGDSGYIAIKMKQENDAAMVMEVADNGKGLPEDFAIEEQQSLGMKLVQTLSRQLNADFNFRDQTGSTFTVRFDIDK